MEVKKTSNKKRFFSFFIVGLIVISVLAVSVYWMKNRPRAKRTPSIVLAPLVNIVQTEIISHKVVVPAMGKITPSENVDLSARVSGEIIKVREALVPGMHLQKGDFIAQIEPVDFKLILSQKESDLVKAEFELELERAQVAVAKREYELLGENVSKENRALILREPHLSAAVAKVSSATAALTQAKINLKRTQINAPFNSIVKTRFVSAGMQINTNNKVVTLIGSDSYWIEASLSSNNLKWINFGDEASKVIVKSQTLGKDFLNGSVKTIMSDVEKNGRMARVIIEVLNPLKNRSTPLLIDDIVTVEISGKTIDNVIQIPRSALHNANTIWLFSKDKSLKVQTIKPIWTEKDAVYISADSINKEYSLVTSSIPAPVSGMKLRIK